MKYNTVGTEFEFVFNGHGLEPTIEYCLIYIVDPGPDWAMAPDIFCLGIGTANGGGEVHIAESADIGEDLPRSGDINSPGAKIWLVLSENCDSEDWGKWAGP